MTAEFKAEKRHEHTTVLKDPIIEVKVPRLIDLLNASKKIQMSIAKQTEKK